MIVSPLLSHLLVSIQVAIYFRVIRFARRATFAKSNWSGRSSTLAPKVCVDTSTIGINEKPESKSCTA